MLVKKVFPLKKRQFPPPPLFVPPVGSELRPQGYKVAVWGFEHDIIPPPQISRCVHSGGVVWTLFPTCSSPCHLFLTVYPRKQKPVGTSAAFLNVLSVCQSSEEFRELGENEPLRAERKVASACMCAHTKVIIMMMNGTGWRKKRGPLIKWF